MLLMPLPPVGLAGYVLSVPPAGILQPVHWLYFSKDSNCSQDFYFYFLKLLPTKTTSFLGLAAAHFSSFSSLRPSPLRRVIRVNSRTVAHR
jgi:hypothetical protein